MDRRGEISASSEARREGETELKRVDQPSQNFELERKLNASGLPKPSKDRFRKRFNETGNIDWLDGAIAEEREWLRPK